MRTKKILSLVLAAALMISAVPTAAFAETVGAQDSGVTIGASGLCDHHTEHTEDCGYTEVTPETCTHEHTEACYEVAKSCIYAGSGESVSDNTATPSDTAKTPPTDHSCSEESGCITKTLNCTHTEHTGDCGYAPATEGTPCAFACAECAAAQDGGEVAEQTDPVAAVQALIDALPGADEVTAENTDEVGAQLTAIDEAKTTLTDEQQAQLDMTAYEAVSAALADVKEKIASKLVTIGTISLDSRHVILLDMLQRADALGLANGKDFDGYLVQLRDSARIAQSSLAAIGGAEPVIAGSELFHVSDLSAFAAAVAPEDIELAELNYYGYSEAWTPNDPLFSATAGEGENTYNRNWYLERMNALSFLDGDVSPSMRKGGNGDRVRIAILDTGVQQHEDLDMSRIIKYKDFVTGSEDISTAQDPYSHGISVTGLIAANTNNGKGVASLGSQADLLFGKVFNENHETTVSWVVQGIEWAIANNADVINMSLSFDLGFQYPYVGGAKLLQDVIDKADAAGIIVVAAAANRVAGSDAVRFPAANQKVVAVGALAYNDKVYDGSRQNFTVDVCAPGTNLTVLLSGDGYGPMVGTSMATPLVTTLAALCKAEDPTIDHDRFMDIMEETCFDYYPGWNANNDRCDTIGERERTDAYGTGLVNYAGALEQLRKEMGSSTKPAITVQPTDQTVDAGGTAAFSVTATGTGPLSYFWQVNKGSGWENLADATQSTYTTPAVTSGMDGWQYRCVITNTAGSATSTSAKLTVNAQTYTATLNTYDLIGATAALSKDTGILASDTVTLTIIPESGKVFQNGPSVSATGANAGTPTADANGVYTCKFDTFIANATITVSGTAETPHTHTYASEWTSDDTGHWYAATCGHDVKNDFAAHTPGTAATETTAQTCTMCGYEIAPALQHTHTYTSVWTSDDTGHWYAATCNHTDEKGSYGAHSDNGKGVCGVCGYIMDISKVETKLITGELTNGVPGTAFDTLEKLKAELTRTLLTGGSYTADSMVFYDITLQFSTDGGQTWIKATEANFPTGGITVTLPYPTGTNASNYDFIVTHMFTVTSEKLGTIAGKTEQPAVTKLDSGLRVTLKGLSPVGIAWKAIDTQTPTYAVTVSGSYAGTSGAGNFAADDTVTIYAGSRSNYTFAGWTSSDGITFANANSATTTFAMPRKAVTVTANWTYSGGVGGGSSYDYYTITATAGDGGTISPSGKSSVREGQDKTYTITPADGYEISDVLVDGKSVGAVASYAFDNVQKAHTIEAQFIEESKTNPNTGGDWDSGEDKPGDTPQSPDTGERNPFTDVKETDWFYEDVLFVYYEGIMLGTTDTTFSPGGTLTRGMMAAILWRMEGSPAPSGKNPFTDVPADEYYTDAITWANEQGIYEGYGNNLFGPDAPITRQQLATIFYRYTEYKGYDLTPTDDLSRFTDTAKIEDWAEEALKWAVGSGWMYGTTDTTLAPTGTATRAQIAAMLHRFIKKYGLEEK